MTLRLDVRPAVRARSSLRLAIGGGLLSLAACASDPPTRFHSLLPAEPARVSLPAGGASAQQPSPGPIAIVLDPVRVPAQVDQPQWLVRLADGSLQLLEQDRWAAPLRDELHAALIEALALRWGAVDGNSFSGAARPWRITVDVARFESVLGREARLEVRWRIVAPTAGLPAAACVSVLRESADSTLAIAQAHQRIVVRLADEIGATLQALARNAAARCPASAG
ncbi:MAG: PqiC family protein [Burkholderiaceae bacterium]